MRRGRIFMGNCLMGDLPVTDLVRDDVTGDLYAATDFGVLKLAGGNPANGWVVAGSGLPMVEVAGLTILCRVLRARCGDPRTQRLEAKPAIRLVS